MITLSNKPDPALCSSTADLCGQKISANYFVLSQKVFKTLQSVIQEVRGCKAPLPNGNIMHEKKKTMQELDSKPKKKKHYLALKELTPTDQNHTLVSRSLRAFCT